MRRATARSVLLPEPVREELERTVRQHTAPQRDVLRARIALMADRGSSNAEIQRELGCDIKTVRKWRNQIAAQPDKAVLQDAPRSGRPPRVATVIHAELVKLACSRPDEHKIPFEVVWTLDSLSEALERETKVKLSRSEIWRVLKGCCLRPHRVQQWLHSPDPEFRPKVEAICQLYVAPPADATVLCVDEMTGIQALEPRFPLHPPRPRRTARKEFEYRRHGTRALIGAFNVKTGKVVARCGPTRTAADLIAFMDEVAKRYPVGEVYIVWDNLNIHHGPRWEAFNQRHGGRFHFVYTPLHASWVNQIEIWFSIVRRRVLKHASFSSTEQLSQRLLGFVEHWNKHDAKAFQWKFRGQQWRTDLPSYAA